jgi:phage shock protein E
MQNYILPLMVLGLIVVFMVYRQISGMRNKKKILAKIDAGAKVIDVRTTSEFSGAHYNGAVNIPVDKIAGKLNSVGPKDKPVILYCASGMRSATAAGILKNAGFTDVTNAGSFANMPK